MLCENICKAFGKDLTSKKPPFPLKTAPTRIKTSSSLEKVEMETRKKITSIFFKIKFVSKFKKKRLTGNKGQFVTPGVINIA